jgi:hypothetical protein
MPEVYRLEYLNGAGIYWHAPDDLRKTVLGDPVHQEDPIDHPRPSEDGMGWSAWSDMIFGFASLEAMRAWFNGPERLYLATYGVLLSAYFARGPIITGKKQLAFYRQSATLLWQRPINHF